MMRKIRPVISKQSLDRWRQGIISSHKQKSLRNPCNLQESFRSKEVFEFRKDAK